MDEVTNIQIKLLRKGMMEPVEFGGSWTLFCPVDVSIPKFSTSNVSCDVSITTPKDVFAIIGLYSNNDKSIHLLNDLFHPGKNEIVLNIYNVGDDGIVFKKGDPLCHLIFTKYICPKMTKM